jgi:hypothetical protein
MKLKNIPIARFTIHPIVQQSNLPISKSHNLKIFKSPNLQGRVINWMRGNISTSFPIFKISFSKACFSRVPD